MQISSMTYGNDLICNDIIADMRKMFSDESYNDVLTRHGEVRNLSSFDNNKQAFFDAQIKAIETDRRIFRDKSILKKYQKYNHIFPQFKFNFLLINQAFIGPGKFLTEDNDIVRIWKNTIDHEGHINIIFKNNWAINFYPFTPWILMHRVSHCLEPTNPRVLSDDPFSTSNYIISQFEVALSHFFDSMVEKRKDYANDYDKFVQSPYLKYLLPFRSARILDGGITPNRLIDLDLFGEFLAYFHFNGKINLIDPSELPEGLVDPSKFDALRNVYSDISNKIQNEIIKYLNNRIGQFLTF